MKDGSHAATFAGCGKRGTKDGKMAECRFDSPSGICASSDGTVLVCDRGSSRIRLIDVESGMVGIGLHPCHFYPIFSLCSFSLYSFVSFPTRICMSRRNNSFVLLLF